MYNTYEEPSTTKFVSASVAIHICVFASILYIATQIKDLRPPETEPVLMEIVPLYGNQMLTTPEPEAPVVAEAAPVIATSKASDEVVLPAKAVKKISMKPHAKSVPLKNPIKVKTKATFKANPNLNKEISDLENEMENLNNSAVAMPYYSNDLSDTEVEKELNKTNQKINLDQAAKLTQANADIDDNLKSINEDFDKEYSQAEAATKQEAQKVNEWAQARRSALGKEKALLASQAAQEGPAKVGTGAVKAEPQGAVLAQTPIAVRALEDLKQMPGNERPHYDLQDRLQKRQGTVQFLAYISKDGRPVKFKLDKSTGFRELDGKTLAALKKWKFYPGQEGWVEIPFVWDLTGDAKEFPTGLRRK